jgi:ribosomal protein L11 methyltransferase
MPKPSHWTKLEVEFTGLEDSQTDEAVGGLAECCGALGACESGGQGAARKWLLFFDHDADREELERSIQAWVVRTLEHIPGQVGAKWEWACQLAEDWADGWRDYFQPIEIAPWFRIAPPWAGRKQLARGMKEILIDPGLGFGTGGHETTRLCLECLGRLTGPESRVLDVGSGSGILSIAAVKAGAAEVTAVEIDPDANENARKNFALNGIAERITLIHGEPGLCPPERLFTLAVCNMLLANSEPIISDILERIDARGVLVLAGFLVSETSKAESLLPRDGTIEARNEIGEWGCLVWKKP